ncbi:SDR family NAD(P)-dependent oxidoreductase [Sphingobium sp. TCM1]|uniref:SDR family NAD(P)-dependent oxidoreductase n=1 Tax=Sphingobium sp. TCM1 TaxID=453246 RepID=UPI0007F49970|nr:SDR family NAD(P)-dependent oxidoreductase [Sphingobium sp. TCM1]OAN56255.1 hypothetical protein A7Q26_02305 [Sphingobium sp. TCM1]
MQQRKGNFVFVGGTHGIGRAAAMATARGGSAILLVARNKDAGDAAVRDMIVAGAREAQFLAADLSTVAGMKAAADGIMAWKPQLHGLTHSAMSAFGHKIVTPDGLEFAFAIQYLARAIINRLCVAQLAASGDGRIVHIAGAVPYKMARPVLDDLQFERRKWSFFKAILTTHVQGFEFLDEAARQWADLPVRLYATGVGSTKTKAMQDPDMPLIMRIMARFGTTPDKSARNAIRLLLDAEPPALKVAILPKPDRFTPEPMDVPAAEAAALWDITTALSARHGVILP